MQGQPGAQTGLAGLLGAVAAMAMLPAQAQEAAPDWRRSYTLYGTPGLVEMPSAQSLPDGTIAMTLGGFDSQQRATVTFQILPRLTGSFRYSHIDAFEGPGTGDTYDRSFDLQYRLVDEGRHVPAVAVGLRDFMGTGLYTAEYIVATKTLSDRLRVTGGIGWGRLGSHNGFANPLGFFDADLKTRPELDFGQGGTIASDQFFRGDAALFGGVEWRINDRLTVIGEYSSDAYARESGNGTYDYESPLNFALNYAPNPGRTFTLAYLNGAELAFGATFTVNPGDRPAYGGLEPAPLPVAVRSKDARAAASWDRAIRPEAEIAQVLEQALALDGMRLIALDLEERRVRLRFENDRYRAEAQAIGRIARALTQVMPPSVEIFVLEPVRRGIPLSQVVLRRSDIEAFENEVGASEAIWERMILADAGGAAGLVPLPDARPRLDYGLSPYLALTVFDGSAPMRADVGLQFAARYRFRDNLILAGAVRKRIGGNRDEASISSDPALPAVRSHAPLYARRGDPGLTYLTLTGYGRPGEDLYSRVTLGYLEQMFGGISTELLWKPVNGRIALGAEVNYVAQRDYDLGFGFRDYDVVTGHVSAYYDFGNDFHGQLDIGRYLAGDWGATLSLHREFSNGWRVGAYVTRTDVPYENYGEGSFDKGISVAIPLDWMTGRPSRQEAAASLSSLKRDGGARLEVQGRLYEIVRKAHGADLEESWGRFWR